MCERRGVIRPNKKDLTERIRLFMRTPAFNAMFEVFRRDLEVMDRRSTWAHPLRHSFTYMPA